MKRRSWRAALLPALLGLLLLAGCGAAPAADNSAQTAAAQASYEAGDYRQSLESWLQAVELVPRDMTARLGAIRCQLALGSYTAAARDLELAAAIDPAEPALGELYLELGRAAGDAALARRGVELAQAGGDTALLETLPPAPELTLESGSYTGPQRVAIRGSGTIYYTLNHENGVLVAEDLPYAAPLPVTSGHTVLTAWCVRDGVPGPSVTAVYDCVASPAAVSFTDPVLERMVRAALGKGGGTLSEADCERVTSLSSASLYTPTGPQTTGSVPQLTTLADLDKLPNLTELALYDQPVPAGMEALAGCPFLQTLTLARCGLSDWSFVRCIPGVRTLNVPGNAFTDLAPLAGLPCLQTLDVRGSEVTAAACAPLTGLQTLTISGAQLPEAVPLAGLPALRTLNVEGWDGADLAGLASVPALEALTIRSAPGDTALTTAPLEDIGFLAGMPQLTRLYLAGVADPEQLAVLQDLDGLRSLTLYDSPARLDAAAMQALRAALPHCRIVE